MSKNFIQRCIENGYSFFNTGSHEKKVLTSWTQYQTRKPNPDEVLRWMRDFKCQNYAICTGEISNLVVFDVDTKNGADPTPFQNLGMFEIRTPSGGYHFYCQYDPLLKSTKHKKADHVGILKSVDVQSNGALVFCPPSQFANGGYEIVNDVPIGKIPDDLLIQVLEALEPEKAETDPKPYVPQSHHFTGNAKPGDIYNALASWDDVLMPLGWTKVGHARENGRQFWRRPGKRDGISASTNYNGYDLFFAYTTSSDAIAMRGYTKFTLYALFYHNGNFSEASKSLVMKNSQLAINHITN